MAKSIVIELTDEEEAAARAAIQPYREYVNNHPALMSLLYDIDLLPEQVVLGVNANRMGAVCELFKMLTEEQIKAMFMKGIHG